MLAFWSGIALGIRAIAIALFLYVLKKQWELFSKANVFASERRLKKLLFGMVLFNLLSNLPIMYLHYARIVSAPVSETVISIATVMNALSSLVIGVLLLMIYCNKNLSDD